MTLSPWSTVRAIFEEVVELAVDERRAVLQRRCGGDGPLRRAVEELLAADTDADAFLASDRIQIATLHGDDPLAGGGSGLSIAGFTVERLLGSGGMGAVYAAQQEQPRRAVALKVLRPELCTDRALRRFRVEAEILGRLQHPHIAEVYAAGVHELQSGPFRLEMPWYAMELLRDSAPLTTFAAERRLDVAARVVLLRKVCDAVQHAHARGVIHRDLKPANVLVGSDGEPKVIDFGVARVAGAAADDSLRTEPGALLGTPSYMAPEQFRGVADDVDVRCDVWALGVMLYELLCGRLPYDFAGAANVESVFARTPAPVRACRADAGAELEWITARALAPDREQRYPTAAAFADDLGRLLRHEPVVAAPPGYGYQLRKALRRHRALVLGAAAVFVALLAGIVATGLALERAERSRRSAEQQAQRADGFVQVLRGAFKAAEGKERGRDATIADLVAEVERSSKDTSLPILVRSSVVEHLGILQFDQGEYEASIVRLREALALLAEGDLLGGSEEMLTRAALSESLRMFGNYAEQVRELERATAIADRVLDAADPIRLSLLRRQGFALGSSGRHDECIALFRRLLAIRRERLGADAPDTAESQADLGMALVDATRLDEAVPVLREACATVAATHGADSRKALTAQLNLSTALLKLERPGEAEAVVRDALPRAEAAIGEHTITQVLRSNLAQALRLSGRPAEAVPILAAVLATHVREYPPYHPRVLNTAGMLARAQLDAGDLTAAAATLMAHAQEFPEQPADVQRGVLNLRITRARLSLAQQRSTEAESELLDVYARSEAVLGPGHEVAATAARLLAEIHDARGETEAATLWRARLPKPKG